MVDHLENEKMAQKASQERQKLQERVDELEIKLESVRKSLIDMNLKVFSVKVSGPNGVIRQRNSWEDGWNSATGFMWNQVVEILRENK